MAGTRLLIIFLCLLPGWAADVSARESYRLLQLDGAYVKWGPSELGTGAVVTYALVDEEKSFPRARNCRKIAPVEKTLSKSGLPRSAFLKELKAAFSLWADVAQIRFRPAADRKEADILIGEQMRPVGRAFANVRRRTTTPGTQLAFGAPAKVADRAVVPKRVREGSSDISGIEQSLICLNPEQPWKIGFDGNLDVYDLRYTLAHEIGHTIGLDHPSAFGQLMSFGYDEKFKGLQAGDIAGAVRLYGESRKE